jgi:hypothetical protein
VIDECINSKINTSIESILPLPPKDLFNSENDELIEPIDEDLSSLELQDTTPAKLDLLPVGGERVPAKVLKRRLDLDNKPIGKRNSNPKLDTHKYDVQLPCGSTDSFTANTIVDNLYAQIDAEGCAHTVFKDISCYNNTYVDKHGRIQP